MRRGRSEEQEPDEGDVPRVVPSGAGAAAALSEPSVLGRVRVAEEPEPERGRGLHELLEAEVEELRGAAAAGTSRDDAEVTVMHGKKFLRLPAVGEAEEKQQLQVEIDASPRKEVPQQTRRRGFLLQVCSSFSLTSMLLLGKVLETEAVDEDGTVAAAGSKAALPVLEVVLVRSMVVTAIALSILAHDGESPLGHPPCARLLVLRGIFGSGAVIAGFFAVTLLPLPEVIACSLTSVLWSAILGRVFLGEKLKRAVFIAMPLCMAGVLLMALPQAGSQGSSYPFRSVGAIVSLSQGACAAAAKSCVRALGKGGYHPQVIIMYLTAFGSTASALALFGFQGGPVAPASWQWAVMVVIGCCAFVGQTTTTLALRSISATEGFMISYLNLVWSEVYSIAIFSELPSATSTLGAALIVLCTLLLLRWKQ